jgi:ppGpp synthetase/RelA/SpoT-type nucleotidyltranferase
MSKYRAIMTTTDRERIIGETEVSDEKRYQAIHRVRSRVRELETDVEILEEHHPELLEELREVVCSDK